MFMWVIFNSLLLVFSVIKILFFLRVNEAFGLLVQLLMQVLVDLTAFVTFFISWLFLFSMCYRIAGATVDQGDYPHVTPAVFYVIQIFRNSIGDVSTPVYDFWSDRIGESPLLAKTMIGYSWLLFTANAFFMLILLLNFLIAIIS